MDIGITRRRVCTSLVTFCSSCACCDAGLSSQGHQFELVSVRNGLSALTTPNTHDLSGDSTDLGSRPARTLTGVLPVYTFSDIRHVLGQMLRVEVGPF